MVKKTETGIIMISKIQRDHDFGNSDIVTNKYYCVFIQVAKNALKERMNRTLPNSRPVIGSVL